MIIQTISRVRVFEARFDNCIACENLISTLRNGGIGLVVEIFTGRTLDKEVNDGREDTRSAEAGRPTRSG